MLSFGAVPFSGLLVSGFGLTVLLGFGFGLFGFGAATPAFGLELPEVGLGLLVVGFGVVVDPPVFGFGLREAVPDAV